MPTAAKGSAETAAVDHRRPTPIRLRATPIPLVCVPLDWRTRTRTTLLRYPRDETDIQAPEPQAREQARISGANEHQGRASYAEPPPPPRSPVARRAHRIQARRLTRPLEAEHERLPRASRIRRTRDIRAVLRRGTRKRTPALDVYVLPPPSGPSNVERRLPRVGWIVPKLGNGIVARNRLKRRLRDIGRRRVLARLRESGCGADVLVRVRRSGYRTTYGQLEDQWMSVVEKTCSQT